MILRSHMRENTISVNQTLKDRESVLMKIAKLAAATDALEGYSARTVFNKLLQREQTVSTAMEHGIAIPHCSLKHAHDIVMGVVTLSSGIDFGASDNEQTSLFVFIIAPNNQRNYYIRLLSATARALHDDEKRTRVINANSAEGIISSMCDGSILADSDTPPPTSETQFNLMTVITQNEDKFTEVLNILTETEDSNIAVIESRNTETYLHALPLFHNLFEDSGNNFQRIVVATIPRGLSNRVIREMRGFAASDSEKPDFLLTVQEATYLHGSISL